MKKILITRPADVSREFADKIKSNGLEAVIAPMLRTKALENVIFMERMAEDGFIFTSPRAVKYFADIGDHINKKLPVYCVGPKTEHAARNAGFEDINTSSGGGQELASLLVKRYTEGAKLLHPCGEFVEDGFYKTLSKHDIEVAPLVVYTMEPIDKMTEDTLCEIRTDDILAAVFFSTRTAENFNHLVKLHGLEDHLQQMQAVCISKNVATALNQDNWQDVIVSDRMNEAALLKSLNRLNG
jgi:uroporphyrinogen-III synthase